MITTILIITIICFAYFVQSGFGFGAGIIAVPLLSHLMDLKTAIVVVTIFALLTTAVLIPEYRNIEWKKALRLVPGIILGLPLGLFLFGTFDSGILNIVLGVYILLYVINDLAKPKFWSRFNHSMTKAVYAGFSGFTGGVLSGLCGASGPMIASYLKKNTDSVAGFRTTTLAIFFLMNSGRCLFMSANNFIQKDVIHHVLIVFPFFCVAIYLGHHVPKRMNDKNFHFAIDLLLLASSLSLLAKQIFFTS